jgi:hypothetical protein
MKLQIIKKGEKYQFPLIIGDFAMAKSYVPRPQACILHMHNAYICIKLIYVYLILYMYMLREICESGNV